MGPFKVEREVRQRLVRRSWNCGKNILKATQSNLATKGSLKPVPDAAEPPSKEEIKELIESGAFTASVDGINEDEEEMEEEEIRNFVSIGSKETPTIEIWDLDVRHEELPCIQLGGLEEMEIIKKKKSKKQKYKEGSHTDSVLGLAWNKEFRNILASGSADNKVKVWDVATGTCKITMEHHTKEVQAIAWNHCAPEVLLSGSFDQTVVLKDGRQPSHSGFKWSVMSDVESLAWDPHCEHSFVVSLEDGTVKGFDIRTAQSGSDSDLKPSFTIQAHDQDKGVSSISYNISAPNLLATGSMDKTVKLWELTNNEPSCIASHKPKAGAV
ncbi:hypothetical protein F2Q69_00009087 [Brassica cretica]|uniref:Anaphase-promoting complex subunit 4 WD40 domain-containing protein n=1 Tax=Brassica cretica TaxID=69181 RepID=A0A8S9NVQ7_BRACR|nr:hypothetical protein F2Q69_00009087 [Brassica cretica]